MDIPSQVAKAALASPGAFPFWKRATAGILSFLLIVGLCMLSIEVQPGSTTAGLTYSGLLRQRHVASNVDLDLRMTPNGTALSIFQRVTDTLFPNWRPGTPKTTPICWPSADMERAGRPLEVSRPGCSTCVAGKLCTFMVHLRAPANWTGPGTGPFEWDLMVTLVGPTMVHGYIDPIPTKDVNDTFVVSYRAFEPGEYRASLATNCVALSGVPVLAAYPGRTQTLEVATWNVTVLPTPPEEEVVSPCKVSHTQGRWVREDGAPPASQYEVGHHYEWEFFPCAGASPVTEALARLASKGFFELAFYGDSHIRQLLLHSMFLMLNFTDPKAKKWHSGLEYSFTVPVPEHLRTAVLQAAQEREKLLGPAHTAVVKEGTGQGGPLSVTVTLAFYWVDGVYQNYEYGCAKRGSFTTSQDRFPDFSNTTDVIITDSGVWAAGFCTQPLLAYSKHLTDLYDYLKARMRPGCKIVTFGTIPSTNCEAKSANTNSMKAHMDSFARTLGQSYGAHNFDLWDVVALRFALTCLERGDVNHYSCFTADKKGMAGVVGKGLSLAFLHYLTHVL